jgi:hypothetical protein
VTIVCDYCLHCCITHYKYSCDDKVPDGVTVDMSFTLGFDEAAARYLSENNDHIRIYHKENDMNKLKTSEIKLAPTWDGSDVTVTTTVDTFCTYVIALFDIHNTRELTVEATYSLFRSRRFSTATGPVQSIEVRATRILVANLTDTELYVSSVPAESREITRERGAEISLSFGMISEMVPTAGGALTRRRSTVTSPAGNSNAPSDSVLIRYVSGSMGRPQKAASDTLQTRVITYSLTADGINGTKTLQIRDNRVLAPGTLLIMLQPVVGYSLNQGSRTYMTDGSTIEPGKLAYAMKCGGVFTEEAIPNIVTPTAAETQPASSSSTPP